MNAVSLLLATLVAGIVGTLFGLIRAEQHWRKAERAELAILAEFQSSTNDAVEQLIGSKPELSEREKSYLENALKRWQGFAAQAVVDEQSRKICAIGHYQVALLWTKLGQTDKAIPQYQAARDLQIMLAAEYPGNTDYIRNLAMTQHNLGTLFQNLGTVADARTELEASRSSFSKLSDLFPSVPLYRQYLAHSYNALGALARISGELDNSLKMFQNAFELRKTLVLQNPAVSIYQSDLSSAHRNLGIVFHDLGRFLEARNEYKASCELMVKLVVMLPNVVAYRKALADSHNGLGLALKNLGEKNQAKSEYRRARDLHIKLVAEFPAVTWYRADLASTHTNLGTLLWVMGQPMEAMAEFEAARTLNRKLVTEFPAIPAHRKNLASTHNNLGSMFQQLDKLKEARIELDVAITLNKKLADDFPDVPEYRVSLGGNYCNYGTIVHREQRNMDCFDWYEKALNTLTPIYEKEPRDIHAKLFLRITYQCRARVYQELKKFAEAVHDYNNAIALCAKSESLPLRLERAYAYIQVGQVTEVTSDLEELARFTGWNTEQFVDLTKLFSLCSAYDVTRKDEYITRAMEFLQKAVKLGFNEVDKLARDKDISPLHNRDDFKKLLAEAKKNFLPKETK